MDYRETLAMQKSGSNFINHQSFRYNWQVFKNMGWKITDGELFWTHAESLLFEKERPSERSWIPKVVCYNLLPKNYQPPE